MENKAYIRASLIMARELAKNGIEFAVVPMARLTPEDQERYRWFAKRFEASGEIHEE